MVRAAPAALILAAAVLPAPAPAAPAQEKPGPGSAAKDFFKGRLVSFKGRRIELSYDFADPAQKEDWVPTYPFLRPVTSGGWRVEQGALRGDGNAGWRHRAVFDGDLKLTATLSCEDAKNFGAVVLDEDHSQFNLFALADTIFSVLDRKQPLRHMLVTFQPTGTGPGGNTEWRDIEVGYEPRISSEPLDITIRKKGAQNEFRFGPSGKLAGGDKESRVGPRLAVGFFTLGARVTVRKAVLTGVLDPAWLRGAGIPFEDNVPDDPDPMEGDKGKETGGRQPEGPDVSLLLRKLADTGAARPDREKAADDLAATKDRPSLRPLIDLMYNEADAVGRELAGRVFKAISGKETGFRADSARESRLKAMPRVWEVWFSVKETLEREERERKAKEK